MDANAYTIDLEHDHLIRVARPNIPGLAPEDQPSPKSLRRWIKAGRLAALDLPGTGQVTSLEAIAAAAGTRGAPGKALPPARPALRSTAARRRDRAASTRETLEREGLA
jgi:hypothetical protein